MTQSTDTPAFAPARVEPPGATVVRVIAVVWRRDLLRLREERIRAITSLVQPFLFLFVLGTGLGGLTRGTMPGVSLQAWLLPGVAVMAVLFAAMLAAGSIVWDREFGFLREMMVSPAPPAAVITGKCLGGATGAFIQGLVVLAVAGLAGVPYDPSMMLQAAGLLAVTAFTTTAVGMVVVVRMRKVQSFVAVTQLLTLPLFFLSGALFPLASLPAPLRGVALVDPVTYAVTPLRHVVLSHLTMAPPTREALDHPISWLGWPVPPVVDLALVGAVGLLCLVVASGIFRGRE